MRARECLLDLILKYSSWPMACVKSPKFHYRPFFDKLLLTFSLRAQETFASFYKLACKFPMLLSLALTLRLIEQRRLEKGFNRENPWSEITSSFPLARSSARRPCCCCCHSQGLKVADSAHGPSSAGDTEVGCWAVEAFLVAPALFGGETLPFERSMLSVQKINIFSFPLCCWLLVNPVALADCFFSKLL